MAHIVLISFSFRSPRRSYLLYLSSFEHFQVPCAKTNTGEPERTHRKDLDRIKMKSNNLLPHVHSSAARSREISRHQIFRFDKPHSTSCCLPWAKPAITSSGFLLVVVVVIVVVVIVILSAIFPLSTALLEVALGCPRRARALVQIITPVLLIVSLSCVDDIS